MITKIKGLILKLIGINPSILYHEMQMQDALPVEPIPEIKLPQKTKKRIKNKHMFIYYNPKSGGAYSILHNHQQYGRYSSIQRALTVRNFLIYKQWDKQYTPYNITHKKRLNKDEYYLCMKPYLMESAYEKWIEKNKEELEEL